MKYKYTLYQADGSSRLIGEYKKELEFKTKTNQKTGDVTRGLYSWLDCTTIELIPRDYYPESDVLNENVTYFGDEEARLVAEPERNRHMKVLIDFEGNKWDVVGSIVREEKISERTGKSN